MKLQPAVKKETAHIALGVAVGVAVMLAVFALLGRFDYTVALGGRFGRRGGGAQLFASGPDGAEDHE